jgi:hypothetical protein
MPTVWLIVIAFVAALNLRFLLPGLLAFLGLWTPPARI